jgi:hypothetical protein
LGEISSVSVDFTNGKTHRFGGLIMEKQIDLLSGKAIGENPMKNDEEMSIWKSVLQKAIRRGDVEKAMWFALKLAEKNWWIAWKRLSAIADEDVGQPLEIVAVDTLFRKFLAMKRQRGKEKGLSWDMKRSVVCATKILAEAWKDRRADEFLEVVDVIEKTEDLSKFPELRFWVEGVSTVPDEALDVHTVVGRKMGRTDLFWYEVSSETVGKSPAYQEWRSWWKALMIDIIKAKKKGK